jgi:hypoxanthine phosphoribosyltransferase
MEIATRVNAIAHAIARAGAPPEIVVPVLVGAFVFAADLVRALSREGLDLPVEFLWLASYGEARAAGDMRVRVAPSEAVRGKHVLLMDGVLDHGRTLSAARDLLTATGASAITTAVVIDKRRVDAPLLADHACFTGVAAFVVGYGMDDAGLGRGWPYMAKAD